MFVYYETWSYGKVTLTLMIDAKYMYESLISSKQICFHFSEILQKCYYDI